ncbi:hypothetical protein N8388_01465 [Octadecabacter sp.]|nr:hypothetical protein [Octadecabacter sp.]MDC1296860.1 hypothetical protein [Octadecabacter sp.]MDC1396593.1 hypothetical protein [Octadecabacter sp.]MDC1499909.1 hypothetical protein [Octadecabacter sp.]
MAKSTKSKPGKSKIDASVDDTVEVTSTEDSVSVLTDDEVAHAEANDISYTDVDSVEDGMNPDMEVVGDPEPQADPAPETNAQQTQSAGAGFLPLLLGGVVAGAIGYGVATYFPMNDGSVDVSVQMQAQADQLAALEAKLADIPAVDLSGVEAQIASVGDQAAALSGAIDTNFADLDARLTEVEKRPGADGTLSDTALAAYQRELEQLRADLEIQQATVMSTVAQAETDLAAARAEAEALEQEALASAEAAASRAALNRVSTAIETGAPFADALGDLGGDLPAALSSAAENGVATTAELTSDFPAAARAALAAARAEGVSDESGGLGGFLRNQFDVRSTAPQEGSSPDAVLSRAEAAIKEGRVADALAEIEALPEVARAEMTDWTAQATERADVLDAVATLSETYN